GDALHDFSVSPVVTEQLRRGCGHTGQHQATAELRGIDGSATPIADCDGGSGERFVDVGVPLPGRQALRIELPSEEVTDGNHPDESQIEAAERIAAIAQVPILEYR